MDKPMVLIVTLQPSGQLEIGAKGWEAGQVLAVLDRAAEVARQAILNGLVPQPSPITKPNGALLQQLLGRRG